MIRFLCIYLSYFIGLSFIFYVKDKSILYWVQPLGLALIYSSIFYTVNRFFDIIFDVRLVSFVAANVFLLVLMPTINLLDAGDDYYKSYVNGVLIRDKHGFTYVGWLRYAAESTFFVLCNIVGYMLYYYFKSGLKHINEN